MLSERINNNLKDTNTPLRSFNIRHKQHVHRDNAKQRPQKHLTGPKHRRLVIRPKRALPPQRSALKITNVISLTQNKIINLINPAQETIITIITATQTKIKLIITS